MTDKFFDINKLPKDFGILVFPISISRMENRSGQDVHECLKYVKIFTPKKVSEPKIGLNLIYGDNLYMNSDEKSNVLKERFMQQVIKHKNGFKKLIGKSRDELQIQHAFSYEVWNQFLLDYEGDFLVDLKTLRKIYSEDKIFQKYVLDDSKFSKKELDANGVNFFLEEHLIFYFLLKNKVRLPNEYIQGREKWILWCYPGVPLKAQAYIFQKNFFKLDAPENPYQNCCYDLESKKLIDYTKIDLEKYNYKY